MKTLLNCFVLVLALQTVAIAQTTGPEIEFEKKVVDYGQIEKGSDGIRTFVFTNIGDEDLVVSKVYSSCGCTIPKKPETPIAPGEKGEIQVKYNTNLVGPIRKTITVNSNAKATPIVSLKIKGTVSQ